MIKKSVLIGLGLAAVQVRRLAAQRAADILGIQSISFGDFPDNKMDTIPLLEIIQSIEKLIDRFKPEIIFTHHAGDLNVDHRRTHEATAVACRPKNGRGGVNTLLFFEIPSSTEWQLSGSAPIFAPNWFVDISKTFKRKLDALDAYHDELRDWPHPRSLKGVEHLARWRGATIGVDAAEAFILGRRIT